MTEIQNLINALSAHRFPLNDEKSLQFEIAVTLKANEIRFIREYHLGSRNIVDFFIPDFLIGGVAMEVKISGNAKAIYRQCERYCKFESVKALILVTNRSMGFPKELCNKPCYVLKLGKAWL